MLHNYENWEKEEWTLRELEQKKLITLHDCSGGFFGYDGDLTYAPNEIFLQEIVLKEKEKKIELICKTKSGSNRQGSIKSENIELLKEIKNEIEAENLIGKSMDKVFSTRIRINKKFLENENS